MTTLQYLGRSGTIFILDTISGWIVCDLEYSPQIWREYSQYYSGMEVHFGMAPELYPNNGYIECHLEYSTPIMGEVGSTSNIGYTFPVVLRLKVSPWYDE